MAHLLAVAICLCFSLADRSLLVNHSISRWWYDTLTILLFPALLAWVACPAAVLIAFVRKRLTPRTVVVVFIAEVILCIAQFIVLLPSMQ
jgi:MFS-type transporter involved in bile tolerance (Atg22 family)